MSGAHVNITYWPEPDDQPHGQVNDTFTVLYFSNITRFQGANVQFSRTDDKQTIRYLRALAEAAANLADQVESAARADRGIEL